jgi:hypothetical protein
MENTNTNTIANVEQYDVESISSFSLRELMQKNSDETLIVVGRNPEKELTLWKGLQSGKRYIETNADACEEGSEDYDLLIDEF